MDIYFPQAKLIEGSILFNLYYRELMRFIINVKIHRKCKEENLRLCYNVQDIDIFDKLRFSLEIRRCK